MNGHIKLSLPSRERGLKFTMIENRVKQHGSLPSRERGLKFDEETARGWNLSVAPFTGAWIEM